MSKKIETCTTIARSARMGERPMEQVGSAIDMSLVLTPLDHSVHRTAHP